MENSDGSIRTLQITFAMKKRNAGYYPLHGGLKYFTTPFDTNDNETYLNEFLPDESQTKLRGKLANCALYLKIAPSIYFSEKVMLN